jgi:hypothetical protein
MHLEKDEKDDFNFKTIPKSRKRETHVTGN